MRLKKNLIAIGIVLEILFFFMIPPFAVGNPISGYTGKDLLRDCKEAIKVSDDATSSINQIDLASAASCVRYLDGFEDMDSYYRNSLIINKYVDVNKTIFYCPPGSDTLNQDIRIVVQFLEEHPGELNLPATLVIIMSLSAAFPCS